jgi:hypothetical protein
MILRPNKEQSVILETKAYRNASILLIRTSYQNLIAVILYII